MVLKNILNLLLPPLCPGCHQPVYQGTIFCAHCHLQIEYVPPPLCPSCGTPGMKAGICPDCLKNSPPWNGGNSLFVYEGPVAAAIRKGKYGNNPWIFKKLGPLLLPFLEIYKPDLLIPIPPTRSSWNKRGFCAALELARSLKTQVKTYNSFQLAKNLLIRKGHVPPQASLSKSQRQKLRLKTYKITDKYTKEQRSKTVVLLDDVFTTGATLKTAAKVLRKNHHQGKIYYLTLSRSL